MGRVVGFGSGCFSVIATGVTTRGFLTASLHDNATPPPLPPLRNNRRRTRNAPVTPPPKQQQQPSVAEVERAIGAGIFRDRDPRGSGERSTLFDMLVSSPLGQPEGSIERKLRETGEWVIDTTEGASRSAGQRILLVVCLGVLPVWVLLLLVASGVIKLPFSAPFLDDLLM
ncbi:PREDICTED: probable NAD(P)H dehydrogenase subunit CRR3, chloroplastic [Nelumbo nucifera]|uniref:Probable NAD(P)H dehydrogenase subunit CRR3, chloroplastic n=1 Tax=Nelumbo nucifera TaxID=4432 RepID=A0A1U8AHY4_NELNU|nr:PREDICTED: probable NAD(P)H dehydrogenase subunit CRR3, chloroplastic [Nelumbo nucifera]